MLSVETSLSQNPVWLWYKLFSICSLTTKSVIKHTLNLTEKGPSKTSIEVFRYSNWMCRFLVPYFHFIHFPELDHRVISALFSSFFLFLRDQSLTDIMPLYKTMKKATFSDSEDEVCLHIYMCTQQFVFKQRTELLLKLIKVLFTEPKYCCNMYPKKGHFQFQFHSETKCLSQFQRMLKCCPYKKVFPVIWLALTVCVSVGSKRLHYTLSYIWKATESESNEIVKCRVVLQDEYDRA